MKKRLVGVGIAAVAVMAVLPAALPAAPKAQTVNVSLSEFKIKGVPAKLKPGAASFVVKNAGKFPHNITVLYGPVHFKTAEQMKPGSSQTVTANLKPGAYILACTVGSGYHASQGMLVKFTVGTFDFTTFKWHA
jgi:plastocyanin